MTDRSILFPVADQELKTASRLLSRNYGGQAAMAAVLGRRQQHYSDCTNANVDCWLTIQEAAILEDSTRDMAGHPPVTRAMAARQGFALVRVPDALPDTGDLLELIGALATESGEVTGAIVAAVRDKRIDGDEIALIDDEADQLIEVAMRIKAAARAWRKGDR